MSSPTSPDHPLIRAEAALLLHPPGSFASHSTAARAHGLPVPQDPLTHVRVRNPVDRRRRDGIRCHVGESTDVVTIGGVRVSGAHAMFVELASMLSLVDLVVVGDALVRLGKATSTSLVAACEGSNHKLRDEYGRVTRRFDLSYPSVRLIVEYDGRQHVEVQENWHSDLERREEFDEAGRRILVVTSKGIYKDPAGTVARVHRTLRLRGWRGLPARTSDAWRPFFPGR